MPFTIRKGDTVWDRLIGAGYTPAEAAALIHRVGLIGGTPPRLRRGRELDVVHPGERYRVPYETAPGKALERRAAAVAPPPVRDVETERANVESEPDFPDAGAAIEGLLTVILQALNAPEAAGRDMGERTLAATMDLTRDPDVAATMATLAHMAPHLVTSALALNELGGPSITYRYPAGTIGRSAETGQFTKLGGRIAGVRRGRGVLSESVKDVPTLRTTAAYPDVWNPAFGGAYWDMSRGERIKFLLRQLMATR